jgi:hypothetical protein
LYWGESLTFVRGGSIFDADFLLTWVIFTCFFTGIGAVCKRHEAHVPNLKALRYCIATFAFLLLAGGWAIGFRLFGPFSRFGGIISAIKNIVMEGPQSGTLQFALEGLLAFVALAVVVVMVRYLLLMDR